MTSSPSYPYRLRLPGPISIPERIRQATARPIVNHRGPEMRVVLEEIQRRIQPLFGTKAPVLTFGSSGTGVMEASLVNVLAPGEKVLALTHDQFGDRYAQIARELGVSVSLVEKEVAAAMKALLLAAAAASLGVAATAHEAAASAPMH